MTTKEAKDRRVVIVAGAQGVSGNAVLKQYAALPGTTVYGLSRRSSESSGNTHHISVDLLSPGDVKAKLGQLKRRRLGTGQLFLRRAVKDLKRP